MLCNEAQVSLRFTVVARFSDSGPPRGLQVALVYVILFTLTSLFPVHTFIENSWAAQTPSPLSRYPPKKHNSYRRKGTMRCYGPSSTSPPRRRECTRSSGMVQTQRRANHGLSLGLQNMMLPMILGTHGRSSKRRRKKGRKRRNVSCYGLDASVVF